jgi:hypothetical protein
MFVYPRLGSEKVTAPTSSPKAQKPSHGYTGLRDKELLTLLHTKQYNIIHNIIAKPSSKNTETKKGCPYLQTSKPILGELQVTPSICQVSLLCGLVWVATGRQNELHTCDPAAVPMS